MCETIYENIVFRFIGKTELVKLRKRALRSGVWFKVLHRIDRVLIDLTIKVANTIRSARLAKSIFTLVGKLEGVMESGLSRAKREIVFSLAQKFSLMTRRWDNASAKSWASDSSFAVFLAAMDINNLQPLAP